MSWLHHRWQPLSLVSWGFIFSAYFLSCCISQEFSRFFMTCFLRKKQAGQRLWIWICWRRLQLLRQNINSGWLLRQWFFLRGRIRVVCIVKRWVLLAHLVEAFKIRSLFSEESSNRWVSCAWLCSWTCWWVRDWGFRGLCWFCKSDLANLSRWKGETGRSFQRGHIRNPRHPF